MAGHFSNAALPRSPRDSLSADRGAPYLRRGCRTSAAHSATVEHSPIAVTARLWPCKLATSSPARGPSTAHTLTRASLNPLVANQRAQREKHASLYMRIEKKHELKGRTLKSRGLR